MTRFFLRPLLLAAALCLFTPIAMAQEESAQTQPPPASASGLPLPRFTSLAVEEANLRTGPGTRYPIEWVYRREGMPLEITAEFEIWRRVRDWEGSEGWLHKVVLSGKRSAIVTATRAHIYEKETKDSATLAHVQTGAIGALLSCKETWCKVKFQDIKGYMPKSDFWGAHAGEVFD